MSMASAMSYAGKEFEITRLINAPRDLVWKAFTEKDHLMQWWGPKGFTVKTAKVDLRPGGIYHYGMESANGQVMWGRFIYREIVAPERLVFVLSFSDEQGGIARHFVAPNWPLEMLKTVTFEDRGGRTLLTLRGRPINATDEEREVYEAGFDGMNAGFGATWDQLDAYLAKLQLR